MCPLNLVKSVLETLKQLGGGGGVDVGGGGGSKWGFQHSDDFKWVVDDASEVGTSNDFEPWRSFH